jgi:uncharacterized SAM-binding protein YcdF (DUF218 family)
MTARRLVVVLGYSGRRTGAVDELHAICVARLKRAELEAKRDDVVLLSGRARGGRGSEADLMARRWEGPPAELVLDRTAGSTYGNAVATAALVRSIAPDEVVVVTSSWHARRALALVRAALRGSATRVVSASAESPRSVRASLRELACWTLVPVQRPLLGRGARTRPTAARVGP